MYYALLHQRLISKDGLKVGDVVTLHIQREHNTRQDDVELQTG